MTKNVDLYLQEDIKFAQLPLQTDYLTEVVATTLAHLDFEQDVQIGIACVDKDYSHELNLQYRQKDKPTNVLSFPSDIDDAIIDEMGEHPLGDLVICLEVVLQESLEQNKTPMAHFTHLVVHGVLHLLGYDHEISDADADEMEGLEIDILAKLGIDNPYRDDFMME